MVYQTTIVWPGRILLASGERFIAVLTPADMDGPLLDIEVLPELTGPSGHRTGARVVQCVRQTGTRAVASPDIGFDHVIITQNLEDL